MGKLVCCFSCLTWFKKVCLAGIGEKKRKISPLIAFHKCQENLQDRGLCDRATAEKKLSGGGEGTLQKGYTFYEGLFRFPIWHFLYDADDFNAPDAIMSRIFFSVDVGGVAFKGFSVSNPFSIERDLPPTWRNYKQTQSWFIARSCFYINFTPRMWSDRVSNIMIGRKMITCSRWSIPVLPYWQVNCLQLHGEWIWLIDNPNLIVNDLIRLLASVSSVTSLNIRRKPL